MEVLHCPDNIKVHFAGAEVCNQLVPVVELGVSYGLYTAYPFVERKIFGKGRSPILPLKYMTNPFIEIPRLCSDNFKHCIQDSGLFTLMFGAMAGKHDENIINKWYDGLVEFTMEHCTNVTCVEIDCQKVLGVKKAWEFRERIKKDLPNNRIINVFHLEDGIDGLDRMIEFSEYIAISVPELRFAKRKQFVLPLAKYIKRKKPNIDIHLLGCTELDLLKSCKFCTSADSTTYTAVKRYGFINGIHQKNIKTQSIRDLLKDKYDLINTFNNEINTNGLCLNIEYLKNKYQQVAGNQDYYYTHNLKQNKCTTFLRKWK